MAGASCSQTTESPNKTPYPNALSPIRQSPPKTSTKTATENNPKVKSEGIVPTHRPGSPMSVTSSAAIINQAEFEVVKKELQEAKAKIEELATKKVKEEEESKGE